MLTETFCLLHLGPVGVPDTSSGYSPGNDHEDEERAMGMLGGLMKAEIARRVFNEARKPHNQAKAKELFRSVTGKSKGTGPRRTGR